MSKVVIYIVIAFIVIIGTVLLQSSLAVKKSKWPGLVLPGITFFISLFPLFSMIMATSESANIQTHILQTLLVFIVSNLPTIFLLALYFGNRKKVGKLKRY